MPLDLNTPDAARILSFSKTQAVKYLQVAVRTSQGRKRASWAHDDRPHWWKENVPLEMPSGDIVASLPFASQSKTFWDADSVRVTCLLYEFKDSFDNVGDLQEQPNQQAVGSPKLVKVADHDEPGESRRIRNEHRKSQTTTRKNIRQDHTTKKQEPLRRNKAVTRKRRAEQSLAQAPESESTAVKSQEHSHKTIGTDSMLNTETENTLPNSSTLVGGNKRTQRNEPAHADEDSPTAAVAPRTRSRRTNAQPVRERTRRRYPTRDKAQPDIIVVASDDEDESPSTTSTPITPPILRESPPPSNAHDSDSDQMETNQSDTSRDEEEDGNVAAERAREAHIEAIEAEQAEFNDRVQKKLVEFRKRSASERKELHRRYKTQLAALDSAFGLMKMKNYPPRVLAMPMVDYVREYNADAGERLLKDTFRNVQRVIEQENNGADSPRYRQPARTPHAQARREQVTATARKAKRAARERREEFAVPTTSLRSRPQRSAAKMAATRTQAILQGSAIRRPVPQSVRRTTRKVGLPPLAGTVTPGVRRTNQNRARDMFQMDALESIRKHPNPQAGIEELEADLAAMVANLKMQIAQEKSVNI